MKKILLIVFALAILGTSCAANRGSVDESSVSTVEESTKDKAGNKNELSNQNGGTANSEATLPKDKASASKTLDGELKFYPTYDSDFKTASNEIFDFWFDIPNEWNAVDLSDDGSKYTILPDNGNVLIEMYGVLKNCSEEEFYASLAEGSGDKTEFTYRDGWIGKKITTSRNETWYVRVDGDSFMVLHINPQGENEWMEQNAEKINYIAMSARTTRESYGTGKGGAGEITLDDLQLGGIKLDMTYDELIKVMKEKPQDEVKEEFGGMEAKTLFFADGTQVYVVENHVYSVNVISPDYLTPRGLKTGDSIERLTELYGEPATKDEEGYYGYSYDGYELFSVIVKENKVSEIQISIPM